MRRGGRSDRDLILACRNGDRRAWREVLDKYERLVFSIARSYGLSREDAADVTQLTFTILVQSMDDLREDSRLGAWLSTVVRRHTWRLMEKGRREATGREKDAAETADFAGVGALMGRDEGDTVERWELIEFLQHGLSLVSEACRRLITALYFDETQPSYAEVSEKLGIPVGSIGPTRARCLANLRRALAA